MPGLGARYCVFPQGEVWFPLDLLGPQEQGAWFSIPILTIHIRGRTGCLATSQNRQSLQLARWQIDVIALIHPLEAAQTSAPIAQVGSLKQQKPSSLTPSHTQ